MKEIDNFTALEIEDKGKYGFNLIQGYVSKDGKFRPLFCKREIGKDRIEKTMPLNISLGDKAKAIEVAFWLYKELTGSEEVPF